MNDDGYEPDPWATAAAVLVITLAGLPEPVTQDVADAESRLCRVCALCRRESMTPLGPVTHSVDCVWRQARELAEGVA